MMIVGNSPFVRWIFGDEIGGYIQAGLILGAIFMIIRLFKTLQEKGQKGIFERDTGDDGLGS